MATNITNLTFDDGATLDVVAVDSHVMHATSIDLSNPAGVFLIYTESSVTTKTFIPWHFVQSINQVV